jgi:hypothetical protein
MILEPKRKNFEDKYKIKERVKKMFNIRRHMSMLLAFELHVLSGNSKLVTQSL